MTQFAQGILALQVGAREGRPPVPASLRALWGHLMCSSCHVCVVCPQTHVAPSVFAHCLLSLLRSFPLPSLIPSINSTLPLPLPPAVWLQVPVCLQQGHPQVQVSGWQKLLSHWPRGCGCTAPAQSTSAQLGDTRQSGQPDTVEWRGCRQATGLALLPRHVHPAPPAPCNIHVPQPPSPAMRPPAPPTTCTCPLP